MSPVCASMTCRRQEVSRRSLVVVRPYIVTAGSSRLPEGSESWNVDDGDVPAVQPEQSVPFQPAQEPVRRRPSGAGQLDNLHLGEREVELDGLLVVGVLPAQLQQGPQDSAVDRRVQRVEK